MQLNINELREAISEQIQKLRDGKGDIKQAREVGNLSHELCRTYQLEMNYYKTAGRKPQFGSFLPPPADDKEDEKH